MQVALAFDDVVPPVIATFDPLDLAGRALDDQHRRHVGTGLQGFVDGRLQGRRGPAAKGAVGRHHEATVRVEDARRECLGGESAKDDRVDGAEARKGQHREDRLGDHGHVDGDPVALFDAELNQRIGGAAHFAVQLVIRDGARLALDVGDPVVRHTTATAFSHVDVDTTH